jgi:hypothetical protein
MGAPFMASAQAGDMGGKAQLLHQRGAPGLDSETWESTNPSNLMSSAIDSPLQSFRQNVDIRRYFTLTGAHLRHDPPIA